MFVACSLGAELERGGIRHAAEPAAPCRVRKSREWRRLLLDDVVSHGLGLFALAFVANEVPITPGAAPAL
jgi:hypothetical protein